MTILARTLDPTSAAGAAGDAVCLRASGTVTRAVAAALTETGYVYGLLVAGCNPGAMAQVLVEGAAPPSLTGLAAVAGKARVNTTTARAERVASLSGSDYPVGDIDATGLVEIAAEPAQVLTRAALQAIGTPRHGAFVHVVEASGSFGFSATDTTPANGTTVLVAGDGSRGRWTFATVVASLTAGPGLVVTGSGALTVAADPPPLTLDTTSVANASGRSGVYTEAVLTYASSIDPALTTLTADVCYDNGCAAAAAAAGTKLPVLVLMHGYSQNRTYITQAFKRRAADHGFLVVAPNMRGRGGDPGSADDCRDRMDIWDAITKAEATYPTVADVARKFVMGYSGGGGDTIALATKFPGLFVHQTAFFGWGDVGYNPHPDRSYWGSKDNRAEVVARVGPRTNLSAYRARSSIANIAQAISQSTGQLYLFWDSEDPVGRAMRDVRDALVVGGAPATKWLASESTIGSTARWLHNYPDNVADLILAEQPLYRRQSAPAPTVQHTGVYDVAGYVVHGAGFEVWTAAAGTTDCRLAATGGRDHCVRVEFDAASMRYVITPKTGTCAVTVRQRRTAAMRGAPTLTMTSGSNFVDRSSGSWYDDGYQDGDVVTLRTPLNNVTGSITINSATRFTLSVAVVNETAAVGTATAEKLVRQLTKDVSAETVFDLGNTMLAIVPDATVLYEAHQGVTASPTVTSWAEQTGHGPATPVASNPSFIAADPLYPSVDITAGITTRLRANASDLLTGAGDFSVVCRFNNTAGQGTQVGVSFVDESEATNHWLALAMTDTNFFASLNTSVTDYTATFSGYTPFVLGWNTMFVWRTAGTLWLQVNHEAPVSVAVSGNTTLTRMCIGALDRVAGFGGALWGLDGAVSHVLAAPRALTEQERSDLYWYTRQLGVLS